MAGGGLVAVLAVVVQLIDGTISPQFIGYAFLAGAGLGLATTTTEAPAIVICGLFGAFLGGGLVALGKEARVRVLQEIADRK